tara:strand:+ start:92 stop:3292 length:3201 start_codon:yes stop_codon:yes gene_type:complete
MNFLINLIFGILLFQPSIENEIVDQASHYLENISNNVHLSESYWALNELHKSSCSLNNSVIRVIINSDAIKVRNYFRKTPCEESSKKRLENRLIRIKEISLNEGLVGLAVNYLLNEQTLENKSQFLDIFIEKWQNEISQSQKELLVNIFEENTIDYKSIPEFEKEIIFYSFLYSDKSKLFFEASTLEIISSEWVKNFEPSNTTITNSIQVANLVYLFYDLDKYFALQNILPNILTNKYFPYSSEKTRHLNATSYSLFIIGRYDESLKILRQHLIPLSSYLKMKSLTERSIVTKGVNLYSLGKFEEAKETFETIYFDSTSSIEKSQLFNNLSICYFKLGEKNKYINLQLNALAEAELGSSYKRRLIILRNLFIYYSSIKDSNTALTYLKRAEEIAVSNNDVYELAAIHAFSGTFYWQNFKDSDKALDELNIAQNEFDPNTDFVDFVNALKEEAEILVAISEFDRARSKFEELKQLSIQSSNTPNYLESLIGLTEIELLENNFEEASKIIEEIKIYPLNDLDFELLVKYNTVKSSLLFNIGYKRKAYNELIPVIQQVIERAKTSIDSQTGFWSIEPEYVDAFNTIIRMLISLGDEEKALQLLDELKTINDVALYNSPILRAKRLSEEDLAQDQLLNTQILKLRTEYLNSPSSEKFDIKAEIDQLSAQREQILSKIRTDINNNSISSWSLQKKLADDEMIIHFTEIGEELYSSYITREFITIDIIEFDAKTKLLFEETANNLASSKTNLNKLYEVYKKLGIERHIPSTVNSLTVIPDNYLFRLPLGILPVNQPESSNSYGSTNYLIEKYDIRYYTSINNLITNSRKVKKKYELDFSAFALSNFSGFDNKNLQSLPFATEEVRTINNKLDNFNSKSIFLESDADKSAFLKSASSSRIVHVATHSEVSEQDPLFSTIYLNNNSDDQLTSLYAYELFDIQMNSELVMLNSCSSGSGSYLQGSGIMGISRALRYAGAKSLALNLWSVNDKAASEFATSFYTAINEGSSKWEAMRTAKLSLLKTGNANPYYWGSYMLIGNSSPLTKKPAKAGFLYPVLLLIIIFSSYKLRKKTI